MSADKLDHRLVWRLPAIEARQALVKAMAADDPLAAIDMDKELETVAERARLNPKAYRVGRVRGTREMVVKPNHVVVYRATREEGGWLVDVLHARQKYPR